MTLLVVLIALGCGMAFGVTEAQRIINALTVAENAAHARIKKAEDAVHARLNAIEEKLKEKL